MSSLQRFVACESSQQAVVAGGATQQHVQHVVHTNVLHKVKHDDNTKWVNNYVKVKKLGEGSFGKVSLYLNEHKKRFAIKAIHKRLLAKKKIITRSSGPSGSALELVRKEIRILNALPPHPNVARLFEVIDDPNCEKLYLCLEYAGKPLNGNHQYARMQKHLVGVLGQVARGLEFLHGHGVIHGDLKVEHLLAETEMESEKKTAGSSSFPWMVKIVDFGSSETFEEENDLLTRSPGTPVYTAPECCTGNPYSGRKADIWALGIAMYRLRYGTFPFESSSADDMYEEIQSRPVLIPCMEKGRPGVEDQWGEEVEAEALLSRVLKQMLLSDPAERPTASEIVELLEESKTIGNRSIDEIEEAFVVKCQRTSVQQQM